jgi:lysophospholipase L1-like esterase
MTSMPEPATAENGSARLASGPIPAGSSPPPTERQLLDSRGLRSELAQLAVDHPHFDQLVAALAHAADADSLAVPRSGHAHAGVSLTNGTPPTVELADWCTILKKTGLSRRENTLYWQISVPQTGEKWQRNNSPLVFPVNPIKFLTRNTCAYSIGSCFAVNINRWLKYQGFELPDVSWGIHYNSRTVLYELRRAVGMSAPNVDWRVPKPDGSLAFDDALRHCIDARSMDELSGIKAKVAADSRRAFEQANAFFITLGLSDIWETMIGGESVTLNRAPYLGAEILSESAVSHIENRFLTVEECIADLGQIVELIRTHKPAGTPIVFSVSPTPLKHAGRFHPQIANSRSKATLLAAIFGFLDGNKGDSHVSYFPAYEFFQTNPLAMALWQSDDRHPSAEAVNHVAEAFVANYSLEKIAVRPGFVGI